MPKILLYRAKHETSHRMVGKALSELPEGQWVIEIKRHCIIRSLSQNRYYHFMLNIISVQTGHSHEELHEAMKLKFNGQMIHFPKGGSQMIGRSTANLETNQFTAFVNRVKQFAIDEFSIILPEAGEVTNQHLMEAENNYEQTQSGW